MLTVEQKVKNTHTEAANTKRKLTAMKKRFNIAHRELLKIGLSQQQIQSIFGMCENKLKVLRDNDPEIMIAYQEAMDFLEDKLTMKLIVQAVGYNYEEEKEFYEITPKGGWKKKRKEVYKRHQPGSTSAFIFLLANRWKDNWKVSKELVSKKEGYDSEPNVRKQIESLARDVLSADTQKSA